MDETFHVFLEINTGFPLHFAISIFFLFFSIIHTYNCFKNSLINTTNIYIFLIGDGGFSEPMVRRSSFDFGIFFTAKIETPNPEVTFTACSGFCIHSSKSLRVINMSRSSVFFQARPAPGKRMFEYIISFIYIPVSTSVCYNYLTIHVLYTGGLKSALKRQVICKL